MLSFKQKSHKPYTNNPIIYTRYAIYCHLLSEIYTFTVRHSVEWMFWRGKYSTIMI